jgi:8-oxo-dGTP diphosphatase
MNNVKRSRNTTKSGLPLMYSRLLDRLWWSAYRVAYFGMRIRWRVWPVAHQGALVAVYVDRKLLLIRNSYRRGWTFPGGGVERGETPLAAATRELCEELGLRVTIEGEPTRIRGAWEGRPDTVEIFDLVLPTVPELQLDYREVIDARFVAIADLSLMPLTGPVAAYVALRWPLAARDEHPGL